MALPREILNEYSNIDFDVKCLMTDPVAKEMTVFQSDGTHLTKKLVTYLELLSSLNSRQVLMYGNAAIKMQMRKEIWLKCDGASGQLQSTKLTSFHFDKNTFSWINVNLVTELLYCSQPQDDLQHKSR